MTRQRKLILAIVKCSGSHLTAEEVLAAARRELPGIVTATVYNNLNALCESGAIRRTKLGGRPDQFEGNTLPHEHLLCRRCGAVRNVPFQDLAAGLGARLGVELSGYDLTLHYVCRRCREGRGEA